MTELTNNQRSSRAKNVALWTLQFLTAAAFLMADLGSPLEAGNPSKGPDREADKLAIDKLTKDMIQAFDNRDAAAIAANWTAEGEYIRNDGEPIRGRAEIQKGYAEFFKTLKGKPKLEIQTDGLRFPSADTAVSEVTLRLKNEEGEVVASGWQATLLVREGGQWKVAIVREWDRDNGLDVSLKELEWLIGTWQAATKDREVTTTYEWDENKAFIRGKYTVKEGAKVIESGTQMIGKDNADGRDSLVGLPVRRRVRRRRLDPGRQEMERRCPRRHARRQGTDGDRHLHPCRSQHLHLAGGEPGRRRCADRGHPTDQGHETEVGEIADPSAIRRRFTSSHEHRETEP